MTAAISAAVRLRVFAGANFAFAQSLRHIARKIGASVQTLTPELAEAMKLKGQLTTTRSHLHGRGNASVFTAVTVRAIDEPGKRVSDRSEIP